MHGNPNLPNSWLQYDTFGSTGGDADYDGVARVQLSGEQTMFAVSSWVVIAKHLPCSDNRMPTITFVEYKFLQM